MAIAMTDGGTPSWDYEVCKHLDDHNTVLGDSLKLYKNKLNSKYFENVSSRFFDRFHKIRHLYKQIQFILLILIGQDR